jgi:lipoyl(octanoyl) transferase
MMKLRLKNLGTQEYRETWEAMRGFTEARDVETLDEIWLVEHPPVYTLGRNGDPAHILNAANIPIVESDRGGQVTYHGPGQLVAYALFDLNRLGIGVRSLVTGLENAAIDTLSQYGIKAEARRDAPGVYVDGKKIASLGLRIRKGCSYHGLSFNVDMDLGPFAAINPCGYAGLEVTQLADLGVAAKVMDVAVPLVGVVLRVFGYTGIAPPG